jgi:hypothetical protein
MPVPLQHVIERLWFSEASPSLAGCSRGQAAHKM